MDDGRERRMGPGGYIGQSVPRREDRNLLLGKGQFVADIQLPNMAHAAFARSSLPHPLISAFRQLAMRRHSLASVGAA